MDEIYRAILEALQAGEAICVATIVSARGSTPRGVGAKMLIHADGATLGTIGGGPMEKHAVEDAVAALGENGSTLKHYSLLGRGADSLSVCGGEADVFLEVLGAQRELVILGGGHVGLAVAQCASLLGFRITVIDDRADFATDERFPMASRTVIAPVEQIAQFVSITPHTSIVIATPSHEHDTEALRAVLGSPAGYIGLIGSKRKVKTIFSTLREEGATESALASIHAPIGLDIGSETPSEIALSIMAEILLALRGGSGRPLCESGNPYLIQEPMDG